MIRLVTAVSLPLLLEGISAALSNNREIEVVGRTSDLTKARELVRTTYCSVVLLDMHPSDGNHLEIVGDIRRATPSARVLLLGWQGQEDLAVRLIRAGASGYLSSHCTARELGEAVRAVHDGNRYLSRDFAGRVALDLAYGESDLPHKFLSSREYQVFRLIVQGLAPRMIGERIGIAVSTVNTHRQRLLKKMGMESNAQLVRYAVKHGLAE